MSGRLAGRVAVVTGGGSGIGAATCRRLAADGARVAVLDIDAVAAGLVAEACGSGSAAFTVDISLPTQIRAAVGAVREQLGPVDILVNNAAVARSHELVGSDEAHWETVLATNFLGAVRTTREVLVDMRELGRGVVVNVASLHASRGYPEWAAYASAKGALLSFTRQQAVEQAPFGIRCNAVTPGAIMTPLNERRIAAADDPEQLRAAMAATSVLGRYGTPEEIAAVIAFVASDEASFMTGADIVCDGGAAAVGP